MLDEFENKIADFIKTNLLFGLGDKVLLAVSGGADSTVLLYAMCALKAEGILATELICAHINHQLRGAQAQADEDFVAEEAAKSGLPVEIRRVDVRGFAGKNRLSIETAARKLRIESLLDIAGQNGCSRIATGHHKNDNAETIIQRLARGTGFRGLGGIWPVRDFGGVSIVRPMLCVTRDEVVEYLEKRNLKWQTDHTNLVCIYRRNYIRHRLIPELQKQCSDSIPEQLSGLSCSAQKFYRLICGIADKLWPGLADCSGERIALDLEGFSNQHPAVKVELVRRSLAAVGSGERDLTEGHYKRISELSGQNITGKRIELPGGFVVWREYEKLIFARPGEKQLKEKTSKSISIKVPGQTRFGDYLIEATVLDTPITSYQLPITSYELIEWFDFDKLSLPLEVRFRRVGDRFWPLGLAGEKKVGKFLTAAKVLQKIREKSLIVCDSEKIIWVWPIRMSEQAKITSKTRKILQLQII